MNLNGNLWYCSSSHSSVPWDECYWGILYNCSPKSASYPCPGWGIYFRVPLKLGLIWPDFLWPEACAQKWPRSLPHRSWKSRCFLPHAFSPCPGNWEALSGNCALYPGGSEDKAEQSLGPSPRDLKHDLGSPYCDKPLSCFVLFCIVLRAANPSPTSLIQHYVRPMWCASERPQAGYSLGQHVWWTRDKPLHF